MPSTPKAWNSASTVNGATAGTQRDVQTVQLANGDYWVIWNDNSAGGLSPSNGYDMVGQRFNALGEAQGDAVELNSLFASGDEIGAFAAAVPGSTDFIMGYQHGFPTVYLTIERKSGDGGHLDHLTLASADATTTVRNGDVALASSTSGIMIFERSNDAGDTDIRAIRFNPSTMEKVGVEIELTSQADDSSMASVTALANGSYAVVFADEYSGSTTDLDIKGAVVKQDGTFTTFTVAGSTAYQSEPAIASLTGGGFVVTWTETLSGDVKAAMYNAAGQLQGGHITVAATSDAENDAQVVGTTDGGFVVAWENDASGIIVLQSFNANGTAAGAAAVVASESEFPLSLTALADGRVLLSWDTGDVKSQIWDPRTAVNATAAYSPDGQQIGTIGNDVFETDFNSDIVHGWDGDDVITDGFGVQELISGDAGNDTIMVEGHSSVEHVDGGTGEDTLVYLSLATDINIDLKTNTSYSTDFGTQFVKNFEHFDAAASITSNIKVHGTEGDSVITTGAGDDLLNGAEGADLLTGRTGNDTYWVDHADDIVVELAGEGQDEIVAGVDYAMQAGVAVEKLAAGGWHNTTPMTLTGNEFNNQIVGNQGKNVLNGGGGNDYLIGAGGNDELHGGEGDDQLAGDVGDDLLFGGVGDDFYWIHETGDKITEAAGEGYDTVSTEISYTLGANVEKLEAYNFISTDALKLVGNGLDNVITGNYGANILNGGAGSDFMEGRSGNDRYIVDNADDVVVEAAGEGIDKVESQIDYFLGDNVENLILTGNTVINGTGNELDNSIVGNSQGNVMDGGMGADLLEGKDGNDRYVIDNVGDKILESATGGTADVADAWINFSIAGQYVETLRLMGDQAINGTGNNQVNTIYGNVADNVLKAAGGDDKLYGGAGNDTLTGGSGKDRFIFDTDLNDMNIDQILDFSAADDAIYLERDVFTAVNNGALNAGAFVVGSAAQDANDRIVYDKANGDLYYDADGSGMGGAVLFASVADNTVLTSADFIGF